MTKHKQMKALKRRKQLAKQHGNTGGMGYHGHLTPPSKISIAGIFPNILKLSKEFLSRNPKDNAIAKKLKAKMAKQKRADVIKESKAKAMAVGAKRAKPKPDKPVKIIKKKKEVKVA